MKKLFLFIIFLILGKSDVLANAYGPYDESYINTFPAQRNFFVEYNEEELQKRMAFLKRSAHGVPSFAHAAKNEQDHACHRRICAYGWHEAYYEPYFTIYDLDDEDTRKLKVGMIEIYRLCEFFEKEAGERQDLPIDTYMTYQLQNLRNEIKNYPYFNGVIKYTLYYEINHKIDRYFTGNILEIFKEKWNRLFL